MRHRLVADDHSRKVDRKESVAVDKSGDGIDEEPYAQDKDRIERCSVELKLTQSPGESLSKTHAHDGADAQLQEECQKGVADHPGVVDVDSGGRLEKLLGALDQHDGDHVGHRVVGS